VCFVVISTKYRELGIEQRILLPYLSEIFPNFNTIIMDLKKFIRLRESYKQHVGRGKSGRDQNGDEVKEQTQSVWFDRRTIQELLDKTDEKGGGIKIYFGEYDKETASEVPNIKDPNDLVGKLTVILGASNYNEDPEDEALLRNGGRICPPDCGRD